MQVIDGRRIKVQAQLQLPHRRLQDLAILLHNVVAQRPNHNLQIAARNHHLHLVVVLDLVHPHRADLRLVLAEHLRQRRAPLRVLLQHVEAVRFARFARLAAAAARRRAARHVHLRREQAAAGAAPVQRVRAVCVRFGAVAAGTRRMVGRAQTAAGARGGRESVRPNGVGRCMGHARQMHFFKGFQR